MNESNGSAGSSSLSYIEKLVGIAIALMSGWVAFQSAQVKDSVELQAAALDSIKLEIARNADDRETRKLNHDITIKIFEEVSDIYKTPNQTPDQILNRLLAVSALVEAIPQSDVRTSLAAAVKAAADNVSATVVNPSEAVRMKTEAVKNKVDNTLFRADQNDIVANTGKDRQALEKAAKDSVVDAPKWSNYDFDFFWCESANGSDAAKRLAETAAAVKQLDPNASGRWRVRKLPIEINAKPDYRVSGFKMHVTSDDEQKIAEVLQGVFTEQGIPSNTEKFEIRRISYTTPWYISVFFCPAS